MAEQPTLAEQHIYIKPGLHSYNAHRKTTAPPPRRGFSYWIRTFFLVVGLYAVGYYGYTVADTYVYQQYENWAFNQEISGRHVTVKDWLMEITPLGSWTGYQLPAPAKSVPISNPQTGVASPPQVLAEGDVMGRVEIPRLHLSSVVKQGVTAETLRSAVGHVPSTQAAGAVGNFAIAAHRDTLFRALKDIRIGDTVEFESPERQFTYQVISTQIVRPADVSVLRPDGNQRLLTMITCYPFYYVGSAPKRFIVKARLLDQQPAAPQTR